MKIESLELNISALKDAMGASLKVEDIKKDLIEYGAVVRGYRDEQNRIIMVITGDIDIEDVENVFGVYGIDVNEFIIDEDEYIPDYDDYDDYDDVEVFDNKNTKRTASHINERKGDCCPKKKNMVNLAEALSGKTKVKTAGLDTIIDNITGKHISENVAISAIKKAKKESTKAYLIEHLDAKKYNMIWESLESGKKSLYENVKINKKSIADYTKDELVAIREKVLNQISALEGLAEKEEELARKKKLSSILEDEISFRTANAMLSEEDAPSGLEFKDLNPNSTNEDEQKNNDEQDSEEQSEEQNDEDTNDNPDKDEEVEIGSIIVTLASKQAAEDLAQDLYDAGVPEDAVEIEPVESEDEEDTSEENAEESEENSDEETAEPAEEEKPEESVKTKGNKVNEADDDSDEEKTEDDDAEGEGEEKADDDSDDAEAEAPHKLILTNTDYVNELADVLENIWGMEHSEFEELIGGEIVSSDDTEEKSDDAEEKSDDTDETADDMDFDPDKIFNDL